MSERRITFFFDVISPYAYLGWHRALALAERHDVALEPTPVLFAALLDHHGQKGPAEIEAKRRLMYRDILRQAHADGVRLKAPFRHPFNPLLCLRVITAAPGGSRSVATTALFRATWSDGLDVTRPDVVQAALDGAGLDGAALVGATQTAPVKQALKAATADAIARGVFGVPTWLVGEELLWGSDQGATALSLLGGVDVVSPADVDAFTKLEAGAVRPAASSTNER